MPLSAKAGFAAGAVFALIVGGGVAYGANGKPLLLGQSNSATKPTKVTNNRGTALTLTSKPGAPGLTVSNATKVPKLNADLLDGLNSSAFARAGGGVGMVAATAFGVDSDENGVYEVLVANVTCPAGTKRTGGGAEDYTASGLTFINAADTGNSWTVAVLTDNFTFESPSDVIATAVCYNPVGAVPGGTNRTTARTQVTELSADSQRAIAAKAAHVTANR